MSSQPPPSSRGPTSVSLLAGLRARNEVAWREFVPVYAPLIYSWCRRAGIAEVDAGDLTQQVLGKVWASIDSFQQRDNGDSFRGWLVIVTRHTILDFARAQLRRPNAEGGTEAWQRLQQHPDQLDHSTALLDSDLRDLALRALQIVRSTLPPESQKLFELTVLQDKTATEAAALLQSTPAAVRKAKSRILRKLREMLGEVE